MWWIFFISFAFLLYYKIDELIDLYKRKDPEYQTELKIQQESFLEEQVEMTLQLKELIDCDCLITSISFTYMSFPATQIPVKIIQVDDDWVEFRTIKKKKETILILPIKEITSVSKII